MIQRFILPISIAVAIILPNNAFSDENKTYQNLIDSASAAYKNQQFEKAVTYYEQVLNYGLSSANLHYNLGNAYYKQSMLAESILHFEKALKYNPSHADAQYNLNLATNAITDRITQPTEPFYQVWYRQLWQSMPTDSWATLSIIGFIVLFMGIICFIFTKSIILKKILLPVSLLALIISICAIKLGYQAQNYSTDTGMGIVFEYSLNVKSSPDNSGTDLFTIHEGLKVEIIENLGEWSRISIADGRIGWIPSKAFRKI